MRSLRAAPYVVVRRAPQREGLIPVGVRGAWRDLRFPAFVWEDEIGEKIQPEQLATSRAWRFSPRRDEIPALAFLDRVAQLVESCGLIWGPTGSVGFELCTGLPVTTVTSDLDFLIRASAPLPLAQARVIAGCLSQLPIRSDVQIETPAGAMALAEYARGEPGVLLRTIDGPRLVTWGYQTSHPSLLL